MKNLGCWYLIGGIDPFLERVNMNPHRTHIVLIAALGLVLFNLAQADAAEEWLSFDAGNTPALPEAILLSASNDELMIEWNLPGIYIENTETPEGLFHKIRLGNDIEVSTAGAGYPKLPALVEMIRVPDGRIATASIQKVEWRSLGKIRVFPNQNPMRIHDSQPRTFEYSEEVYSSEKAVPTDLVTVTSPQGWGGVAVSSMAVTPFRYTPDTNELELAAKIVVRIDFIPGNAGNIIKPDKLSSRMHKLHRDALINPPDDPALFDVDEDEPERMLVVVREEALETIRPLIDFHHNTGIRTEIWIADDIEDPQEIKDRVRGIYDDTGLDYLFLVGDAYEDDWDVPIFFWAEVDPGDPIEDTDSHSDTWYVCLDGPDQDGFDDHYMDLAVGRIVYEGVDNIGELEIQVAKLMDYYTWSFENQDDFEWLDRALLIASSDRQDGVRVYLQCKQVIENHDYQLPAPELLTAYGHVNGVNNDTVLDFINETGVGIVNYRGHGDENEQDSWNLQSQSITAGTVSRMDNRNRPFVLISSACKTGDIADYGRNANLDCVLESYQKHEGGSICAHGSIISTFTEANSFFDQRMFTCWFDDGTFDLGYSMVISAAEMVAEYDPTRWPTQGRTNLRTYLWQGDPALEIRQGEPAELNVAIEDTIPVGSQRVTAIITYDDNPVEGVRFCIRTENDETYLIGYSDANGEVTIEFDPAIEQAEILYWGVYERNAIPTFGEILVADGFGIIYGQVTGVADENPIEDASVFLSRFAVNTLTDADGNYRIEGVPEGEYVLTASAEGFLPDNREIQVVLNEDLEVNFALRFSQITLDSAEVNMYLEQDEQGEREVSFSNSGNGPLTWTASMTPGGGRQAFELIRSYDASIEIGDTRLNGVVFIDNRFYIAGGNRNGDPNYLYVIDREGRQVDVHRLPDEIAGIGLHDLAWDGEYLYGSSNEYILAMNLRGVIINRIEGPFNPNVALAVDDEGCLWVGNNSNLIYRVDLEGNVLSSIPNGYPVRALAWYPEEPDGYKLQMLVRGGDDNPVSLYQMNAETREIRLVTNLTQNAEEIPGDGLFMTDHYNPAEWILVSMINQGDLRTLRLWHMAYRSSWLSFEPDAGMVEPGADQVIDLLFNSDDYDSGLILHGTLEIENDGRDPLVEVPVTLQIGADAVQEDGFEPFPEVFRMNAAYPNPFNAETQLSMDIPYSGRLTVALYDINGRLVQDIHQGDSHAGRHYMRIDAEGLSSGIYLVVAEFENSASIEKVALIR